MIDETRRVQRDTLKERLETLLRDDILSGSLKPNQRLRAAEMTVRYGVSATPLREVFQRLAAEGLVVVDPRLGVTVAPASVADLRDVYAARKLIEAEALRQSIGSADAQWSERVERAIVRLRGADSALEVGAGPESWTEWSLAHRDFHEALFAACESPWLQKFVMMLYDHSERYRVLSIAERGHHAANRHEAIYRAAIALRAEEAVAALIAHLDQTVESVGPYLPSEMDTRSATP